jgi:hypothetical protein
MTPRLKTPDHITKQWQQSFNDPIVAAAKKVRRKQRAKKSDIATKTRPLGTEVPAFLLAATIPSWQAAVLFSRIA